MPWGKNEFSTHYEYIQSAPFYGMFIGTPQGYMFIAPRAGVDQYAQKRVAACLGALVMPADGVDEQYESTVERFNYFKELESLPPPPALPAPRIVAGTFKGYKQGPEFTLAE